MQTEEITELLNRTLCRERFIYLNGQIEGKLYSVIFIPTQDGQSKPFILFEDGSNIEVESDNKKSWFEHLGIRYGFLNGPKLEYAPEVIHYPSNQAFQLIVGRISVDKHELYKDLKELVNDYYDFYCEEEMRIVIAHIIHTYLISSIGSTFYLFLEGEINTGKSSLQKIMSLLQYNGCFIGQTTIPVLARKLHHFQSTVNIDEFDKAFKQKDEQIKALGFLDSGFYKGGTYEITDQNGKTLREQIRIIQTFSAKTFSANKTLLAQSLESRCVTIHTVRSNRPTKNVNRISEDERVRINTIRDKLFAYSLMNGKNIISNIELVSEELAGNKEFNRQAEILSIICGIEKEFDQDDKVRNYLTEKRELNEEDSKEKDRAYIMFEFLLGKCVLAGTAVEKINFTNAELVEHINEKLGFEEETGEDVPFGKGYRNKYESTPSSVGKMIKLHKVIVSNQERRRATYGLEKGKWEYSVAKARVIDLLKRSSYKEIQEKIKELEESLSGPQPSGDMALPF